MILLATTSIIARKTWFNRPAEAVSSWETASAFVIDNLEEGDAITTYPSWDRTGFPSLEPKSAFMLHRDPILREDLQRVSNLWLIAPSARVDEALAALPFDPPKPSLEKRSGIVTAMRIPVPDDIHWDLELTDVLKQARVERGLVRGKSKDNNLTTCERFDAKQNRWRCSGAGSVGQGEQEIVTSARTCIEVFFGKSHDTTRITFTDLPKSKKLRLRAGWTLASLRRKRSAPGKVSWRVVLGDKELDKRTFPTKDQWHLFDFDTAFAPDKHDLTIEVEASSPDKTEFCFNGWLEK